MTGSRLRRILGVVLAVLVLGAAFLYVAQQWAGATPEHLYRMATHVARWREFLEHYGPWLHLGLHGATYLYLLLCWPRLVAWFDRRRVAGGHAPLSVLEQRRLAFAVASVCVAYESLLLLRYLD